MEVIEAHNTPDGLYRFVVTRSEDGDYSLGFDGFQWHTHGDILASISGLSIDDAIRQYIDELLTGRSYIGIATVGDRVRDVRVTDDPRSDKYKPDDEIIEFKCWDGRPAN